MTWKDNYQKKLLNGEEAVNKFIKDGDTVFAGGLNLATAVLDPLYKKAIDNQIHGIQLVSNLHTDKLKYLADERLDTENLKLTSFFFGGYERQGYKNKKVTFIPMQFNNYPVFMRTKVKPNVSIIPVTPPDKNGYVNIGPFGAGYSSIAKEVSDILIVQVNSNLPKAHGLDLNIHINDIDGIVEFDAPLPITPEAESTEMDKVIANHVLNEIPDGACIQLGIGGTANAVGYGLVDRKHLGIHTEMFTESMKYLIEQGAVDNSRKQIDPGKSVTGFTLGSQELYNYLDDNEDIRFATYEYTNSVRNIIKNDNLHSINTALAIDLTGQVTAESRGFSHFTGVGGQVDFVRGALHSKGGKSFFALSSTYEVNGEKKSKIVLDLEPGAATTTLRTDIQYVATEHGIVNLFGDDIPTRAKKLISIADPDFREELEFQAKKVGYIY